MKRFLRGLALSVSFICGVGAFALLRYTVVAAWIPCAAAAVISAALCVLLRHSACAICGLRSKAMAVAITGIACTAVTLCAIMTANYCIARPGSEHKVSAEVVAKHVRTSHPTRRVGRGRYVADTTRNIYHYEYMLRLPDGNTLMRSTDAGSYARLRIGSHRDVLLRTGLFGWPTMR